MFDVDLFIECVHGKQALWEKKSKEYSDKNCREKAWVEIGEIMNNNWMELDSTERDEKVKEMKNKWRHIRDNFFKFINQGKSGDAAPKKKKKYVYADALTFLLNTIEKRKTVGNFAETPEDIAFEEEGEVREGEKENDIEEHDDEEDAANNISTSSRTQPPKLSRTRGQKAIRQTFTPFQSQLLQKLDKNDSNQTIDDADKSFLMSLLPDYKELTADEKLDFKFMTLQFFRDLRQKKKTEAHALPVNAAYQFPGQYPSTQSQFTYPPAYGQQISSVSTPLTSPQDSHHSIESFMSYSSMYDQSS